MLPKSLILGFAGATAVSAACTGPAANAATVDLVKGFETFQPDIYDDPTGSPTVGYGHLCSNPTCSEVTYPIPLSEADGLSLLQSDMAIAQNCIATDIVGNTTVNANQYGALVSWSFNIGCGNAGGSSCIKRLNAGEDVNTVLAAELPKWNKSKGQVLPGLVRRRAEEVALAQTATSDPALPACPQRRRRNRLTLKAREAMELYNV